MRYLSITKIAKLEAGEWAERLVLVRVKDL